MKKEPKGVKGWKARLRKVKQISARETRQALLAASDAIDRQAQELVAMRRILYSERAQIIYYTDKYRSMVDRQCLDPVAVGFLDLPEDHQSHYIKLAIKELTGDATIVPHDPEAAQVKTDSKDLAKRIIQ